MAHPARRTLLASFLLVLDAGAVAVAAPAFADSPPVAPDSAPAKADSAASSAANAGPVAPSRPHAKTTALDGHDGTATGAGAANEQVNKNTGAPIQMSETRIVAIGDARAVGTSSAGVARGGGPVDDAATAAAAVVQPAHRRLAGLPGGAGGAGKETADAIAAAMPRLVACLPAKDDDMQGGEALIKATVARGGAVVAANVGAFSAMPSSVASCFAAAMGAVSFDPARLRPALVNVHLKVAEVAKHRSAPPAAVASTP